MTDTLIDAPEEGQTCTRGEAAWDCGAEATFALANLLGRHWVTCKDEAPDGPDGPAGSDPKIEPETPVDDGSTIADDPRPTEKYGGPPLRDEKLPKPAPAEPEN